MPDPTVTPDKKPRRRKAKRAEPTAPRNPRTTVLSRVSALGPTHALAYRTLCDGNPTFAKAMRDAMAHNDEYVRAVARWAAADQAAKAANAVVTAIKGREATVIATFAKLDRVARTIAEERGDVPTDDAHAATVAPESDAD